MRQNTLSFWQSTWLVVLRILIGWHFLYEGIVKVLNPKWTSFGYLMDSGGFMPDFFKWIAQSERLLPIVDLCVEWGLVVIGACLIMGLFTRLFTVLGIIMLLFFYLSHPPCISTNYAMPSEGSYLWIDKNLIEIAALALTSSFRTSRIMGLDGLFNKRKRY
ncbi:MAG: DoxX family protein [Bacteroidales bacterium]